MVSLTSSDWTISVRPFGSVVQLRRSAFLCAVGEYGAHLGVRLFRIFAGEKRNTGVGDARLRQRVEQEVRIEGLALGDEPIQIKAVAVQDVGKHLERGEVGAVQAGYARG